MADCHILWGPAAIVAVTLIAQLSRTPYAGAATLAVMILWSCRDTRCALQALTMSVLLNFANPALVGEQPLVHLLKWVLLFVALFRILADWRFRPRLSEPWFVGLLAFAGAAFFLAIAVSSNAPLSLLKLGTFVAGVLAALLGFSDRRYPPEYWLNWFVTIYAVVLVLSAPLEFFPVGRSLNGWAFQGIFANPQNYAVYVAPITVYLTVTFTMERRGPWLLIGLTPWAWYSIFDSGCRTALLAATLSAAATLASMAVFPRKMSARQQRSIILTGCCLALIAVAVVAINGSAVSDAFSRFVMKGDRDAIGLSRAEQIESLRLTISDNPLAGVGFGMSAANVEQVTERDELTGLAVSAPIEQGFLPLAVLTQVGIVGAVPLALFFAALAVPIARDVAPAMVALFWTAVFVNFGEMIFFSTGGLGLHMWMLVAWCFRQSQVLARSVPI